MNYISNDDNENNNNNNKNHKIIYLIELFEKLLNNNNLKLKYIFFDSLLKEWYKINKILLNNKINSLQNINSIYIYNCYKNLIYSINYIFIKHKITYSFYFINTIYPALILKQKYLKAIIDNANFKNIIKTVNWNIFIKITNNTQLNKTIKKEIKEYYDNVNNIFNQLMSKIFIDKIIYRNIKILKINKLCFKGKNNINNGDNGDNGIININKNYLFLFFSKWEEYTYKYMDRLYNYYIFKIKYFQCNNIIFIYKRRLKLIYNIFINNYNSFYSSKPNIQEKQNKNNIKSLYLLYPLNNCFIKRKAYIYGRYVSFYYSITNKMLLSFCIYKFINKSLITYKKSFIINLQKYDNKKKNNIYTIYMVLDNIISLNKYKILSLGFNSIKNNIYYDEQNIVIKNRGINNYKNPKKIIKLLLIYNKYYYMKKIKIPKDINYYFIKWKNISQKYLYNYYIQNKNIIKQKIQNINDKNKFIQNKMLQLKKLNDIKRKNERKNVKQNKKSMKNIKIKKKLKNYKKEKEVKPENLMEKIMLSENERIDSNEFDNYFDELPINYLENLENLKNKNEPIISDLQCQINDLINEIDILSNNL